MFFSSKFRSISKDYYVYKRNGSESLYDNKNTKNLASKLVKETKKMRDYAISMTQSAKWIIDNKKTQIQETKEFNNQ